MFDEGRGETERDSPITGGETMRNKVVRGGDEERGWRRGRGEGVSRSPGPVRSAIFSLLRSHPGKIKNKSLNASRSFACPSD